MATPVNFCRGCGRKRGEGALFCAGCGAPFVEGTPSTAPPQQGSAHPYAPYSPFPSMQGPQPPPVPGTRDAIRIFMRISIFLLFFVGLAIVLVGQVLTGMKGCSLFRSNEDSIEFHNMSKSVDETTFRKVMEHLLTQVPEIKEQQAILHREDQTGVNVTLALSALDQNDKEAVAFVERERHSDYLKNYYNINVHYNGRDRFQGGRYTQIWSWTFLVKRDFSQVLAYNIDPRVLDYVKVEEWRKNIQRDRELRNRGRRHKPQ